MDENSYTFNNLTAGGTYQVSVKVKDSNGRESNKYDIANVKTLGVFTNNTTNYSGTYDGSSKSITVSVSSSATMYYSTSTQLNASNYATSGTTTNPTRTNTGTTKVYWCAVKSGYETYCSNNDITISKATPVLSLSHFSATIGESLTNSSITYEYNGDGTVNCTLSSGSGATCSVDSTAKKIIFTRSGDSEGNPKFIISATAGVNYNALRDQTFNVTVVDKAICTSGMNLAACIKSLYTSQGSNNLYYHNTSLANGANDNSYRFAGSHDNVKNYVCFGSTSSYCPSGNIYRIIGVFGNQVKLIKVENYGQHSWTGSAEDQTTNWNTSLLNKNILNGQFLTELGADWAGKIALTTWNYGGGTSENLTNTNAKRTYDYEVGANKITKTYNAKVGLVYISEYVYAGDPSIWTMKPSEYTNSIKNWLCTGASSWTITPTNYVNSVFHIYSTGSVKGQVSNKKVYVYPTFSLNSTVQITGGSGSRKNPIRIS